jgi:catechol 2,3-dioxygenase-like lactoylglutathione lyase family enzyme
MITSIRHTGIVVNDLETSMSFYCDLLGFKITRQMKESGGHIDNMLALNEVVVTTVKMSAPDGQILELLRFHSPQGVQKTREINEIGISHIAFEVDNLNNEYNRLKDKGILFNSPPQLSPDGYAKVAFCRAPEGTFIELVEVL